MILLPKNLRARITGNGGFLFYTEVLIQKHLYRSSMHDQERAAVMMDIE